jgi:putative peptidoglycan lipid II flippase
MTKEKMTNTKKQAIFRSTLLVTAATVVGYGVSFVFSIVVARIFGASADMDAYYASTSLPNLLNLILVGSLQITLVPIFVSYAVEGKEMEAWLVFSSLFNSALLLLLFLSLIGVVLAQPIIWLSVPGFELAQQDLTIGILRIELPSIIFSGLTGLLASVYYARNRFVLPSIVPLTSTAVKVVVLLAFGQAVGVYAVAIGDLVGALCGCLLLLPILFKRGRYKAVIAWRHPGVHQTLKLALPWVLGNLIARSDPLFVRAIASDLPSGSISYLGYADRLRTIMASIVGGGLAKTLFPRLSEIATGRTPKALGRMILRGARWLTITTIPAAIFFMALSVPTIQAFFERGSFTHEATLGTAIAFAGYATIVFTGSLGAVDTQSFYAKQDTRTPVLISTLSLVLFVPLAWVLSKWFSYFGIAVAVAIRSAIIHSTLFVVLARRLGGMELGKFLLFVFKVLLICILIGLLLLGTSYWGRFTTMPLMLRLPSLAGSLGLALVAYGAAIRIIAKEEVADIEEMLGQTLNRLRAKVTASS